MLQAFAKHDKMMRDCSIGKGFDRHLLGLSLIAKEEGLPVPELFTDPLFSKSGGGGNFALSTSLVGYLRVQGVVVPMVHDGYGFFYHIRDDRCISFGLYQVRLMFLERGRKEILKPGRKKRGGEQVFNHLLFVLRRFVVACSAWKSCSETDAEKLIQQVFHAFHDMIQLVNTAHL
ncbi:hypothetical protein HPG69_000756 [Diceros bicornis minor]|uniref:Choline/carnitine acyltransferase domain-containing protein n=1 Tax=Diceros bicornis minor TaxID=77932 RepID=A0A7J7FII2_DICBM|nr:hypothetical protein HPG69_000756 [Diceros bicornis minor]